MTDFLTSIVWGSVPREITQPYGPTHRGIDIGLLTGTRLFAARSGLVTVATYWGVAIAVDGTNQTDWYLHIDRADTRYGWRAEHGAQIALSGATPVPGGPAPTGPHLHFEVQTGHLDVWATSLNPIPVLTGNFSGGLGSLTGENMPPGMKIGLANMAFNAIYRRAPTQKEEFDFANTLADDGSNFNTLIDGLNANAHNPDIAQFQPDILRADVNRALAGAVADDDSAFVSKAALKTAIGGL
jgi:hypothetical protein